MRSDVFDEYGNYNYPTERKTSTPNYAYSTPEGATFAPQYQPQREIGLAMNGVAEIPQIASNYNFSSFSK